MYDYNTHSYSDPKMNLPPDFKFESESLPYVFVLKNTSFFRAKKIFLFDQLKKSGISLYSGSVSYSQFLVNLSCQPMTTIGLKLTSIKNIPRRFSVRMIISGESCFSNPLELQFLSHNAMGASLEKVYVDKDSSWEMILPPRFNANLSVYPVNELNTAGKPD